MSDMSNMKLKRADPKVLRPVIENYVLENREAWHLDHNIYGGWDNTQIHHVIPVSVASEYERLFEGITKHSWSAPTEWSRLNVSAWWVVDP